MPRGKRRALKKPLSNVLKDQGQSPVSKSIEICQPLLHMKRKNTSEESEKSGSTMTNSATENLESSSKKVQTLPILEEEDDDDIDNLYSGRMNRAKKKAGGTFAALLNLEIQKAQEEKKKGTTKEILDMTDSPSPIMEEPTTSGNLDDSFSDIEVVEETGIQKPIDIDDSPFKSTRSKKRKLAESASPVKPPPVENTWKIQSQKMTAKLRALQEKLESVEKESSEDDAVEVILDSSFSGDTEDTFTALIKYQGRVERMPIAKNDKFEKLFLEVSKKYLLDPNDVVLQWNGRELPTYQTPNAFNCASLEILELYRRSDTQVDGNYKPPASRARKGSEDTVSLKFQTQNKKKNALVTVGKKESFCFIKGKVGAALGVDPGKISLVLDGDTLGDQETPESQDLENEDCVDVLEKSA